MSLTTQEIVEVIKEILAPEYAKIKENPNHKIMIYEKELHEKLIVKTEEDSNMVKWALGTYVDTINHVSDIKIYTDLDKDEIERAKIYRENYLPEIDKLGKKDTGCLGSITLLSIILIIIISLYF